MLDIQTQKWLKSRNRYIDNTCTLWCRKHCDSFDRSLGECYDSYDLEWCKNYNFINLIIGDSINFEYTVQRILLTWNNINYCKLCEKMNLEFLEGELCKRSPMECKLMWARLFAESGWSSCPSIHDVDFMTESGKIERGS